MSNKAGLRTYHSRSDGDHDDLGQSTRDLIDSEINAVITVRKLSRHQKAWLLISIVNSVSGSRTDSVGRSRFPGRVDQPCFAV